MIFDNILKAKQTDVLEDLLQRCNSFQDVNVERIRELSVGAAKVLATGVSPPQLNHLMSRWYESLEAGTPDYSVYAETDYIAELWSCWKVYSRTRLLTIQKPNSAITESIVDQVQDSKLVVDLGCGFGYTTAALSQIFKNARVYGTNLDGTLQMDVACTVATDYGFFMRGSPDQIEGKADLVFANEYFEHFDRPLDHLDLVVQSIAPRYMIIANAFGAKAIGHFVEYQTKLGEKVTGGTINRMFNARMREHGYRKVGTKVWNNRPACWCKE